MQDLLQAHPWFTPWTDPDSGVVSYVLTERVAPLQKAMYYTSPGVAGDGKWLWFYAAFPPARQWHLAVVSLDPDRPVKRIFFNARGPGSPNPRILPEGDRAIVGVHGGLYILDVEGGMKHIAQLPDELIAHRHLFSLATTLTISSDGRFVVLDSHIGDRWLISIVDLKSGEVKPLRWFDVCHHHAMFSTVDPTLIMMGQGPWHDPITGDKGEMNIRMWLMDIELTRYEPVLPDLWFNHNCMSCHEWWQPDGTVAWCDYKEGVYEVDITSGYDQRHKQRIWTKPCCHADCDSMKRFYCGDVNPYQWNDRQPCGVYFFDRETGDDIAIADNLPQPPVSHAQRRSYHLDPHPHFTPDGAAVCYTTSALDNVNVAMCPVEGVLARMG